MGGYLRLGFRREERMAAIVKRRRSVFEEPTSVLDLGGCISPPQLPLHLYQQQQQQQQQQLQQLHHHHRHQKLIKHDKWYEEEEGEDVWAPLAADIEAALKPSSSSSLRVIDFPVWLDEEFDMRLSECGGMQLMAMSSNNEELLNNNSAEISGSVHNLPPLIGALSHAASSSSDDDDKFLEMCMDVFNPVQREDVLQHKIELRESMQPPAATAYFDCNSSSSNNEALAATTSWSDSCLQHQHQQHQQQHQRRQEERQAAEDANVGGIRLVQLLLTCAEAVACRDVNQAASLLGQLQFMASPQGDSMQKVTACFVEGLTARLAGLQSIQLGGAYKPTVAPPAARRILLPESLRDEGFRLAYELCPYIAFGHFAANAAILEAFEGESFVHIVDLGMSNALQWPALLQGLASRPGGPPEMIRITGVSAESEIKLRQAGEELSQLAHSLDLGFEFRAVTEAVESLQRGMLDAREGEAMAINSVFQLHCVVKESRRSLKSVLQSIHELSPKILTLVEQDACHNGPFFLGRFMEALHYYSAIFDSVDTILPSDSQERLKVEQFHFGEEIRNIVACEGPDRVERHERADQWRRRMSRAGFQPKPLKFLTEARTWLSMYYPSQGYTLVEEKGCIVLGWKGKPIVAASTWRC